MNHWVSLSGFLFRKDAVSAARWAAENGFSGIELWAEVPHMHVDTDCAEIFRELKTLGSSLKYSLHTPIYGINISCVNPGILKESLRQIKKALSWASEINIERFILHPGSSPSSSAGVKTRVRNILDESIRGVSLIAREKGVELILENVGIEDRDMDYHMKDFIELLETHNLGCCLDAGHANLGWSAREAFAALLPRVRQVHISDNDGKGDLHLAAGDGGIDWKALGSFLAGSTFPLVHEVHGEGDPAEALLRSRQHLENCFT